MAQRRMFSAKIIESAKFIKMPTSSQLLYFHLGMKADDDGIVEAFNVMRMVGASEDDLKILVAKNYVVVLNEDLVSFITDWNEHNLIRTDRKVDSIYKNLLLQIIPEVKLLESKERKDTILRSKMHKESDLPDKFNGIMRAMFFGEKCPVCGEKMIDGKTKPSIQHNKPISKGGKHDINNISVICLSCNMSIKDNETEDLNNELVKNNWKLYLDSKSVDSKRTECGLVVDSIGKVRLGKVSEGKNNKNIYVAEIIEYLNEKTGKSFKSSTDKTISCLNARWNEGFIELEEYKTVIDIKCKEWLKPKKGEKNMSNFLRPETLFGTKFESYLNEVPKKTNIKPQEPVVMVRREIL